MVLHMHNKEITCIIYIVSVNNPIDIDLYVCFVDLSSYDAYDAYDAYDVHTLPSPVYDPTPATCTWDLMRFIALQIEVASSCLVCFLGCPSGAHEGTHGAWVGLKKKKTCLVFRYEK